MGYGVKGMRRAVILIGGLCSGFCILWFLCVQLLFAYDKCESYLSFAPMAQTLPAQQLQFPFEIPGTTLIAEQIVAYDGLFAEGETVRHVTNVAALLLYNCGQQGVTDAQVRLQAGQVQFVFSADTIPAGARILVPEQAGKEFGPKEFTVCSGYQRVDKSDWEMEHKLQLKYPQMGEIVVSNLTDSPLTGIRLHYKTYYQEADFYVGGNTHIYYIDYLGPRENIRIYPYNYAYGYSKFARIEIGNS